MNSQWMLGLIQLYIDIEQRQTKWNIVEGIFMENGSMGEHK